MDLADRVCLFTLLSCALPVAPFPGFLVSSSLCSSRSYPLSQSGTSPIAVSCFFRWRAPRFKPSSFNLFLPTVSNSCFSGDSWPRFCGSPLLMSGNAGVPLARVVGTSGFEELRLVAVVELGFVTVATRGDKAELFLAGVAETLDFLRNISRAPIAELSTSMALGVAGNSASSSTSRLCWPQMLSFSVTSSSIWKSSSTFPSCAPAFSSSSSIWEPSSRAVA